MTQTPTNIPSISVVIVSRGRPDAVVWCLRGVAQIRYDRFEIIVVGDPGGIDAINAAGFGDAVKTISYDEANISTARNIGIAAAAGDIIAFIDDDAVPEPTWLSYLAAPFSDQGVGAVGGFVRGRNGISFQWRARDVDIAGRTRDIDAQTVGIIAPEPGHAIKTEGTNMAIRRNILAAMGGFDPAFRFFLDETDVNMRMARAGHTTAIAPMAQVHHAYAASARRKGNRAVRDLYDVGASTAVYLRKHCPEGLHDARWGEVCDEQRNRITRQIAAKILRPQEGTQVLESLIAGYDAGQDREIAALPPIDAPNMPFLPMLPQHGKHIVLSGRVWSARALRALAATHASKGDIVSLYILSPTSRFHRVRFTNDGVWQQTGGIFGRSNRNQPWFQPTTFSRRIRTEVARVAKLRSPNEI